MKRVGDYILNETLGSGTTSKVKLGQNVYTEQKVAIKIIKKSTIFSDKAVLLPKLRREISIMRILNHPNILHLICVEETDKKIYLIQEYASNGSLFDSIYNLSIPQAFNYFRQIIFGLEYLHHHGICHRDLKPENILIDSTHHILIADFGFARWMPENVVNTSCGSPHYAAPEVINGKPYDGRAADVWSSGVILYAMLTGSLPFNDPSIRVTIKRIKSGKYVMPIDLDDTIQNLIKRLLTVDADKRITLNQIKNHPAFRIGLPEGYTLPTPLPLPKLDDPIQILPENQVALKVIKRIGFEDLVSLLEENTTNMAKVFFHMMTQPFDPENLPWDSSNLDDENVHPFVSPIDETPFFMFHPELEQQASYGSPFAIPDLIQDSTNSPLFIQEEVIPNIGIDNYELMTKLQWFLRDNSFQWYHPSDRCIIARNAKQNLFITFIATYDEEDEHKINLKIEMAKGTPDYFNAFFREVNSLLSDGIVNEDKQLNEANSFSNDFSDNFSKKSQCNIY